jgi:hypothetical protein
MTLRDRLNNGTLQAFQSPGAADRRADLSAWR